MVHRVLDLLVKVGLAHKIEALKAYVARALSRADHMPTFLICRG